MTLDPGAQHVRAILPYPTAPEVTVYTPTGAAYMKVRPSNEVLELVVRPRTVSESLIYAPKITHKIADTTTTIAAADPDDLPKAKTAIDEILADCNTHIASLTYHVAAGAAIVPGHKAADAANTTAAANMSNLATGYVLADELDDDVTAHLLSTTYHQQATVAADFGGTPATEPTLRAKVNLLRTAMIAHFSDDDAHVGEDIVNFALASATTAGTDEASDQTLINLLKAYWNSHCGIGAANSADLAAVCMVANAAQDAVVAHMSDTTVAHGGTDDPTNAATLSVVVPADDLAKACTLVHAIKDTYNAHCAIVDGGAYVTAGAAAMPLSWKCRGSFFAKTSGPGVFTVAEFRS